MNGLSDNNPLKRGAGKRRWMYRYPTQQQKLHPAQIYTAFILALKFSLTSVKLHLSEVMVKSSNNYHHFTQ